MYSIIEAIYISAAFIQDRTPVYVGSEEANWDTAS
jgi:hypothetical protein